MPRLRRTLASAFGAQLATAIVALVEARGLGTGRSDGLLALWGILAPLGLVVGASVAAALLLLDPRGPTGPRDLARLVRAEPLWTRSRVAAAAPLAILSGLVWVVSMAHVARDLLGQGEGRVAAAELVGVGGLLALLALALALALVSPLRRLFALGAERLPQLVDPMFTSAVAVAASVATIAWGVKNGDVGGGGGALGIFGVLARSELDLRPVGHGALMAAFAFVAPLVIRPRGSVAELVALFLGALLPLALAMPAARMFDGSAALARAVEKRAPLGRLALAGARRLTDRDGDGAARTFGGRDCDDGNAHRSPSALDVPGNGIDEDCSGADTPLAVPPQPKQVKARKAPADFNLVLVTIDTLRPDLGFLGYDLPVSPNLDRLAAKSTVFERAYAPASYTGKSLAPVLIGKYPSETLRNGSHFNTYEKDNVLLAERLKAAGLRTFGAASHWYFLPWSGLTQGFDEFDLSAKPSSGQGDTDTSVTSKELTDAALAQLAKKENTGGRFFMWVHYFDPHAQYMDHPGGPTFLRPGAKPTFMESTRAAYDKEVWFTDKHVGRLLERIEASPFGARTIVVVTSDHGEAFAEHNMNWHGVELWESLVRVPLLVHVPGQPARRVADRRALIDLVPTVLDLLGLPPAPSDQISGESMSDDVFGEPSPGPRDVYLDMPAGPYNGVRRALISGPGAGVKLLHFGGTQFQVFDLSRDAGELTDLAEQPAMLGPLEEKLERFRGRLREVDVKPAAP